MTSPNGLRPPPPVRVFVCRCGHETYVPADGRPLWRFRCSGCSAVHEVNLGWEN